MPQDAPSTVTDDEPVAPPWAFGARLGLSPAGIVVGTAFAALAMTPSLLPRDWLFQGVVSGISGAAGYGVGMLLAWVLRRSVRLREFETRVRERLPDSAPTVAGWLLLALVPVILVVMLVAAAGWQQDMAVLVGSDVSTTSGWLRAGPLLVVVAVMLVLAGRGIRVLRRQLSVALHRWARLPQRLSSIVGAVVAGFLVLTVANEVVLVWALTRADAAFSSLNEVTAPDVEQPTSALRSGSEASLVPWETLGREGRTFVAGAANAEDLAEVAGSRPVLEPIRVYAGLESAGTAEERAELAVAELERTGALERSVVAVVTTTGSGWVNAAAAESLELIHGGDTAIVATQYSYLPSWLSFLVDRPRVEEEGRVLFDTIAARIDLLPEDDQPRLVVYGESLGSQGSEHAFSTLADIRSRADGVLWVGPPNSNGIWRSLVERRDPGSPEVLPVYASGLVVRFAADADDLVVGDEPWLEPRVVYLQHASDPIVWWSPSLLLVRPDWLEEPRGADVSPSMSWYPVVTFWQVTVDMANSKGVPQGHGHNYGTLIPDAWLAITQPEGWTDADTARLDDVLGR